jgi:hypothetical protein
MPNVSATKAAGKAAMRKGMVNVILCISAAGIMTDPGLAFDARDVGVAALVANVMLGLGGTGCAGKRFGAVGWDRLMSTASRWVGFRPFMLSERWNRKNQQRG